MTSGTDAAVDRFLETLSRTGNPSAACQASHLTRRFINRMRENDPVFARDYNEAMEEAADLLEAEAWRRALEGVPQLLVKAGQPVLNADGTAITVRRYSDPLLVMLLRGCKPDKFQRRIGAATATLDPGAIIKEIAADDDPPYGGPI